MIAVHEGAGQADQEPAEPSEQDDPVGGFFLLLEDNLAGDVVTGPGAGSYEAEDHSQGVRFPRQVRTVRLSQEGDGGGGVGDAGGAGHVEILRLRQRGVEAELQLHIRADQSRLSVTMLF